MLATFFIPAETVHSAKNVGSGNGAELATYVVEKGKLVVAVVACSPPLFLLFNVVIPTVVIPTCHPDVSTQSRNARFLAR
jgi:hypothetical protein